MMVLRRCAMVRTVQSSNWVRIVDCIRLSVSRSTAAVASSKTRILVFLRRARARQTSCRWPKLKPRISNQKQSDQVLENIAKKREESCQEFVPEILSTLWTLMVEFVRQARHKVLEMCEFQSSPHLLIGVAIEGIQIHTQGTWEQHWILR